ncbi:hypothetical protein ABZ642_26935 [Streptomyces sp. NPDC007157]|uniref:wHTH domain-containing protein n=1 Tax=Streptomyces sp. NPDC007157 TaxID=3154681 RepID=UPI0033D1118D
MTYEEQLERLVKAAGGPSSVAVSGEIARKRGLTVPPTTIDGWRQCKVIPRDTAKLHAFLQVLTELAQIRNPGSVPPLTRGQWDRLANASRRAREGRAAGPEEPPVRSAFGQHWLDAVTTSRAWQLVLAAERERAVTVRERTLDVVRRLAKLYDERRGPLDQDPWHDPELAHRMTQAAELLLHEMHGRLQRASLAPAEAALIALLPFLYQVHGAYTVAELGHVDPANLDDRVRGGPYREKHNALLRSHRRLVRQAERGRTLPDRGDGRPEIGWWLFHQWARQETGSLRALLAELNLADTGLGMLLDRRLLARLLACAHLPPRKLYARGHDGLLNHEPFPVELEGGEWQKVREDLVGPLFAIAHAMALEATDLPMDVVEHVGIPEPVTAASLRSVLNEARWIPRGDALGLQAACGHPAVVAALVDHTRHIDTLLRDARRTRPTDEIGELPVYAHADEVHEVDDTGEPKRGGEVIRFRLDEARIQELLMGENLYRDRSLAIRELYQNALDACRLRKAWEHARNGEDDFKCRIEFEQGYDKDEQRYYLECRDNGIGMDETVLAEVFSQAGVRFAEHARFREESEAWRRDGIDVYPNSRFGIGVLSYFMLADEIRVTTCPARGGSEQLTVLITGPGHYFRVRPSEERRRVGTTVRLYLRDGGNAPSCVQELRRLLGIAEFLTHARHDRQEATWKPGELRPREAPFGGPDGFLAHGRTVGPPEGGYGVHGQVVWCEHGGGILADGIFIEPRVRRGVLADPEGRRRLRGAVVNLTGLTRPKDLSVDRTEILDTDVGERVEELIRDALPVLLAADPPLLTTEWLADVAGLSPRLADLVTEVAGEAGYELRLHGQAAPVATVGFFPPDEALVHQAHADPEREDRTRAIDPTGVPDDVTLLWRLLAHRPNAELAALTELVPELSRVEAVLAARPSDVLLRTVVGSHWNSRNWPIPKDFSDELVSPGHAFSIAEICALPYRQVVSRMELLGLVPAPASAGDIEVDPTGTALLDTKLRGVYDDSAAVWYGLETDVPPGHLLKAHLMLNIRIDEALTRMKALGFRTPAEGMPTDTPEPWVVVVLSLSLNAERPWLKLDEPVPVGHVLAAMAETGRSFAEVVGVLRVYGLRPDLGPMDEATAREVVRRSTQWGWKTAELRRLDVSAPLPVELLARAALASAVSLPDMARQMEELCLPVGALPDEVAPADIKILSARALGLPGWPVHGVQLHSLVEAAGDTGVSPVYLAARLRAYGLEPPETPLPERVGSDDAAILREVVDALGGWEGLGPERKVPVSAVVRAAYKTEQAPKAVVDRLACYGLDSPLTAPPATRSRFDPDLTGVEIHGLSKPGVEWDRPVPLYHLVSVGRSLLMEQEEVVARLTAFGFRMPGLGADDLDEIDRSLCIDKYDQGGFARNLPLDLGSPISDYLQITNYAGLSLDELLPRLTRLGVDLPRVAEAVRAALPAVPGLVMTPREP